MDDIDVNIQNTVVAPQKTAGSERKQLKKENYMQRR